MVKLNGPAIEQFRPGDRTDVMTQYDVSFGQDSAHHVKRIEVQGGSFTAGPGCSIAQPQVIELEQHRPAEKAADHAPRLFR